MPRRPATFTQADVARALRAAEQLGGRGWVIEILPGLIRLVPNEPQQIARNEAKVEQKPEIVL
jgi:hypothetical protein